MTAALEGGEWSAARPGRTLPPGKTYIYIYIFVFDGRVIRIIFLMTQRNESPQN